MSEDNYAAFNTLDDELKTEFYTSFKEALEELDHCFDTLNSGYQEDSVNEMFRAVHSVKGNCHMVFLDGTAGVCHLLEELVSEFRSGVATYFPSCGEFITFIFLRLEQLVSKAMSGSSYDQTSLDVLSKGIQLVLDSPAENREGAVEKVLESYAGILSSTVDVSAQVMDKLDSQLKLDDFSDLAFMEQIAKIMQAKSIQHKGDQSQLLKYCLLINQAMSTPVDADQLTAAFYMQAFGSRLVTSPVFDITLESPEWERERVAEQVELAAGFLKMSGKWLDAALMILQSFERYDGKGVPGVRSGNDINMGGMILALVRFYQQGTGRRQKDQSEKLLIGKALRRINSEKGYRFNPEMVDVFNRIVHEKMR